jgi:hypothetical protein
VCPEKADEAVIVEDATALKQFKETYEAKYQEEIETSQRFEPMWHSDLCLARSSFGEVQRANLCQVRMNSESYFFSLFRETVRAVTADFACDTTFG